ncbi:unnamed protein product [Brassicogethes aeneus]|uniref:Uncharacterized protein n=1 Tax=Brassicogethes aeneus TaxID=1431903 RepID=A0A9P0AYL5_BRAAE|nr:unnamed protein product [Brassicogethes aeneus]
MSQTKMSQNQIARSILEDIAKGEFTNVLKSLMDNKIVIDTKYAVKVIICCCTACHANVNSPQKIVDEDMYNIMEHVLPFIKEPDETNIHQYYQALFHVVKIFTIKENIPLVLKSEKLFLPEFKKDELSIQTAGVYKNTVRLISNLLLSLSKSEKVRPEIVDIAMIISRLNRKIFPTAQYLEAVLFGMICLNYGKIDLNLCKNYILQSMRLANFDNYSNKSYENLLNLLDCIWTKALQTKHFKFLENLGVDFEDIFKDCQVIQYTELLHVFLFVVYLSPHTEKGEILRAKLGLDYLQKLLDHKLFESTCFMLEMKCSILGNYYLTNKEDWAKVDLKLQLEFYEVMYSFSGIMLTFKCCCNSSSNYYKWLIVLYNLYSLITISLRKSNPITDTFKKSCRMYFQKITEIHYRTQAVKCDKFKKYWSNYCKIVIFNLVALFNQRDIEMSTYFAKMFITDSLIFEKFNTTDHTFLQQTIEMLCTNLFSDNKFKLCLTLTALYNYLFNKKSEHIFNYWIKAKNALKEVEDVQKMTYVDALEKMQRYFPEFQVKIHLDNATKQRLLETELDSYTQKWRSKLPMMIVLKELEIVSSTDSIVDVALKAFGDCDSMAHKDLPKIIQSIIEKYEKKVKDEPCTISNIKLAHLYFLHFSYGFKNQIMENANDIEKALNVQDKLDEHNNVIDPLLKCDVVSIYERLQLDKYTKIIKYLNNSLKLLVTAISTNINKSCEYTGLYQLLLKLNFDFGLHMLSSGSVTALHYALKVAQKQKNIANIVEATSFIIGNLDPTKKSVINLIERSDKCLEELKKDKNMETKKIIINYLLSKCKCFMYHDHKLAFDFYKEADGMINKYPKDPLLKIVNIKLMLMKHKFIMFSCDMGIMDHKKEIISVLSKAVYLLNDADFSSQVPGKSHALIQKFEVYEELIKLYNELGMPRQVRCYGKYPLQLTQEMILPLRSVAFLSYLCISDIVTHNYDDCQVKINGIADILCLPKMAAVNSPMKPKVPVQNDGIDEVTYQMREIMLDAPVNVPNITLTSPSFISDKFKEPFFTRHQNSCACFYCTTTEYQKFVFVKTNLDILLNIYKNNLSLTKDHLQGALNLYELFKFQYTEHVEKSLTSECKDLASTFDHHYLDTYMDVLLNYSTFLALIKNKKEALNVNKKVLSTLYQKKIQYTCLYDKALKQRLEYISVKQQIEEKEELSDTQGETVENSTTPKSIKPAFLIDLNHKVKINKRLIVSQQIPFSLSPDGDPLESQLNNGIAIYYSPGKPKIKLNNESLEEDANFKPQCSKAAKSKVNYKCKALQAKKNSKCVSKSSSTKPTDKDKAGENVVHLRTKTKLLTEKLKSKTNQKNTENLADKDSLKEKKVIASADTARRSTRLNK